MSIGIKIIQMEKELKRLRKGQLQDKLRNISLDTTGFKSDLITRLISHTFESKEPGNADVSLNDKNQCPDAQFKDKSNKSSTTQPKKSSGLEGFVKQTAERKTSVDEEVDSNQKTGSDKNLHYQTESEINHPDAELSNDSNDNILEEDDHIGDTSIDRYNRHCMEDEGFGQQEYNLRFADQQNMNEGSLSSMLGRLK